MKKYYAENGQAFAYLAACLLIASSNPIIRYSVIWYIIKGSGGSASVAMVAALTAAAEIYLKPILVPFADRFDRLKVWQASVSVGLLLACMLYGVLQLGLGTGVLLVVVCLNAALAGLRDVCGSSVLPDLFPIVDQGKRVAQRGSLAMAGEVLGTAAAAVLVTYLLPHATLLVGASLLTLAIGFVFVVRRMDTKAVPSHPTDASAVVGHLRAMLEGMRAVSHNPAERALALAAVSCNLGLFPIFAFLLPIWVSQSLGQPAAYLGWLEVLFSLGVILASAALAGGWGRAIGRYGNMLLGLSILALGITILPHSSSTAISLALMLMGGVGLALFNINAGAIRALATPEHCRSRVYGTVAFVSSAGNPFGIMLSEFITRQFGTTTAFQLAGCLIMLGAAILICFRKFRSVFNASDLELSNSYITRYPDAYRKI